MIHFEVACLSEVRLPGSGHKEVKVPKADATCHIYYSGVQDHSGRRGIALVLSSAASAELLVWVLISPMLARIRLKRA